MVSGEYPRDIPDADRSDGQRLDTASDPSNRRHNAFIDCILNLNEDPVDNVLD